MSSENVHIYCRTVTPLLCVGVACGLGLFWIFFLFFLEQNLKLLIQDVIIYYEEILLTAYEPFNNFFAHIMCKIQCRSGNCYFSVRSFRFHEN